MPGRARRTGDSEPDREPADTPRDAPGDADAPADGDVSAAADAPAAADSPEEAQDDVFAVPVEPRRRKFFVSRQDTARLAGFFPPVLPADIDKIIQRLRQRPDVTLDRIIEPAGLAMLAASPSTVQRVAVATMSQATAQQVSSSDRGLLVEENPLVDIDPPPVPPFVARRRCPRSRSAG